MDCRRNHTMSKELDQKLYAAAKKGDLKKVKQTLKKGADPNYKNIPILMLSVKVTGQEQKEGLAAGANAYLTKPYEGDKLMSTAKKLLKAK